MTGRIPNIICAFLLAGGLAALGGEPTTEGAPAAKEAVDLGNLPAVVFDESVEDWVIDRFAGNNTAGGWFYQGPAREVGGLQNPDRCVEGGDGAIYLTSTIQGAVAPRLMKVAPDGTLRMVMDDRGLLEGPMGECEAGWPVWNPRENTLYLVGRHCLRKVVDKPGGNKWVEVFAGVPSAVPFNPQDKRQPKDGPAKEAVFQRTPHGAVVCDSKGTFYWLEDGNPSQGLRKIKNGVVSTVPLTFKEPMKSIACLHNQWMLSLGGNDDTLYIPSIYGNKGVFRCDLKTGELTRVCGAEPNLDPKLMDRLKRSGGTADGPALTHVSCAGSMRSLYDPFHNAIWVWGNDTCRFRWMKLDGDRWVRTVFAERRPGTKPQFRVPEDFNALGVPGEQFVGANTYTIKYCAGIDSKGGVYMAIPGRGDGTGFWRAHNKKEVKP